MQIAVPYFPAAHAETHDVAPEDNAVEQKVHVLWPVEPLKKPGWQPVQLDAPLPKETAPGGHVKHALDMLAPTAVKYVPAAQLVQDELPVRLLYRPGGQNMQFADSESAEYWPMAQGEHVELNL